MKLYKSISPFFKKIVLLFCVLSIGFFTFADRYSHLELFAQTLNLIKINYFKPIKMETLVFGAIKGLLREIDPHSQFLEPKALKILKKETNGIFYGLGIEIERKDDFLIVLSVIKNSPAQKAGLQQGDKILKIDKKIAKNFTVSDFNLFHQKKSKTYKITVLRLGSEKPLTFRLKPSRLKIQSVDLKELQKNIFYLRIYQFSHNSLFEINKLLKNKKIEALLLDLRGNPGGIFEQAVKISDLFLNEGVIVSYKTRTAKQEKKFLAHHSNTLAYFPLIVLIDEYSASASEILAGALKDHKRALLVGRKTFGKGSIQGVFPLQSNYALKLTIGEYQTPSGNFIHQIGIQPDIKIEKQKTKNKTKIVSLKSILNDPEVYQAFNILKKQISKKTN